MRVFHRIRVEGVSEAADRLRVMLAKCGFVLVPDSSASVTIEIEEGSQLALDSVDSPLEAKIEDNLEELHARFPGAGEYLKKRAGGNREMQRCVVTVPPTLHEAVALAILRAIVQVSEQIDPHTDVPPPVVQSPKPARPWWQFWLFLVFMLATPAFAQPTPPFQQMDVDTGATTSPRVFVGLFTPASGGATAVALPTSLLSGGFRVACVTGCSGSSFEDNTAFTFGTTSISIIGGVFDDVASNAATENSAAAARLTEQRAIHVNLRDASGAEVAVGGGTQYTEDAAAAANPVGTALNLVRADVLAGVTSTDGDNVAARGTDKGELYVKHVDSIPVTATNLDVQIGGSDTVTVTATNLDVQSGGADLATETTAAAILTSTNFAAAFGTAGTADTQVMSVQGIASMTPITVSATNLDVQIGGSDSLTIGTFPDNEPINVAQINGVTVLMGAGNTGTGSQRVTLATDNAALATWGHDVPGTALPTGATVIAGTDGTNTTVPYIDPCQREARTTYVVDIVTAATTEIANAVASEFFYICSLSLFSAGTQNVAIVEDDTDACATPTAGLNGGVTAGEGYNFTAQTGIVTGTGGHYVMKTATANRYLCIITSAAVQLSGTITYVSAP